MLKALIVDDELKARKNLRNLVKLCQENLEVVNDFGNPKEAIAFLKENEVDCVFLDVEMPEMDGFAFLEALGTSHTKVIFTTGHDQYAVKALRANAIDYVLKPIDPTELKQAIGRVRQSLEGVEKKSAKEGYHESLQNLLQGLNEAGQSSKITLPEANGFKIVDSTTIIRVEGDGRYSRLFYTQGKSELITKNLAWFEEMLDDRQFVRVHNSHIVNLEHMIRFSNLDGGVAIMADNKNVLIARRRLKEFKAKAEAYYA